MSGPEELEAELPKPVAVVLDLVTFNNDLLDQWYEERGLTSERMTMKAELATLRAEVERLKLERDEARKALEKAKPALEQSSFCLESITALDEEDDDGNGYSATCRAVKRVVDRALKTTLAALEDKP